MRIALIVESLPDTGGGFQEVLSKVECLTRKGIYKHEFVVFTVFEQTRKRFLKEGIEAIRIKYRALRLLDRWSGTVAGNAVLRRLRWLGIRRIGRHLDSLLADYGIDLVLLTEIGECALCIGDYPFIITVWDLSHRDYPEFPHASRDRTFERRERVLRATLTRALAVIAESRIGATRIANLYQVDPTRIIQLPFLPSLAVRRHAAGHVLTTADDVRRKYHLHNQYVFYPATPAPEKNHLYMLEALIALDQQYGIKLDAVFSGGKTIWDWSAVERQVQALGLSSRVKLLGFVADEEIPAIYEGAFALVMPSYVGPTNLPPLEAVTLGCPVIYSDLPCFREQMGEAALYCDLGDSSSLARHLAALAQSSDLRERLRKAGFQLAEDITKIDYRRLLAPVLDRYAYVSRRWGSPECTFETSAQAFRLRANSEDNKG